MAAGHAIDQKNPSAAPWIAGALVTAAVMIFWHLGLMPLLNPDEGRNASVAYEMQQAGAWLVPTYNGLAYLDKPAFFFKAVALSLSLFGHSEFAARLPSALFAAGTLLLVFDFCRKEYGLRTAALAVMVVSTTPLFFVLARDVIFDMTLAFFVCGAIFAGYFAEDPQAGPQRGWSALSAAAMGFATLVKGPVGFIVPLLVLAIFHRADGRKGAMKRLLRWQNILLFFAIFLPWFVGVSLQRHDFPYYGVVHESLLRFTTQEFRRSQPFYYFLPVILATMLLWSLVLPQTLWMSWKQRKSLARADKLLLIWGISVTIFFSISQSKLINYVLTVVIALGILVARRFALAFDSGNERTVRSGGSLLALVSFAAAVALFYYCARADLIDARIRLEAPAALIEELHAIALPVAIGIAAVALVSLYGAVRSDARAVFCAFVAGPVLLIALGLPALVAAGPHRASRLLAKDIEQIAPAQDVACYECFPPGIPFYLGRNITVFTNRNGFEIGSNYVQFTLAKTGQWPSQLQPVSHFDDWILQRRKPVFLMAPDGQRPMLETLAAARQTQPQPLEGGRYWGVLIRPGEP